MRLITLEPAPAVVGFGVLTPRGRDAVEVVDDLPEVCEESPLRFRRMDRYSALGLAAAKLALRDAGIGIRCRGDAEWGVLFGSSLGSWSSNARYFELLRTAGAAEQNPALFARTVSNSVNGETSIAEQIGGESETFVSGWAAGGEAIAEAGALLTENRARRVLAGGVEAPDRTLQEMHEVLRSEPGMDWLPPKISEGAAVSVLAAPDAAKPSVRLTAYGRGHDPDGESSLADVFALLRGDRVGPVILANSVPADLLRRFREEAADLEVVVLPERTGELGAAGAVVALSLACARIRSDDRPRTALVITRSIAGGTVLLVLRRG